MAQDEAPNFEPALLEAAGALGGAPDEGYVWPTSQPVLDNLKSTAENSGLRRDILQEVNDAFRAEGLSRHGRLLLSG